jgi:FkbM family methyltransferase
MTPLAKTQERLQSLLDGALPDAKPLPPPNSEFVIYGAGNCGRDVMRVLLERGYRIAAFLDVRAASLDTIGGVRCVTPASEAAQKYALAGLPAVIGIFNWAVDVGAIHHLLHQAGFTRIITYYEIFEWFPHSLSSRFWLAPRQFYREHRPSVLDGLALWADELSRDIYLDLLELRLTWNVQLLREPDRKRQYFPAGFPLPAQPMRLVDGGAFDGDSVRSFLDENLKIEAVAAFEPDPVNFRRLCQFTSQHREAIGSTVLFPCGLGDQTAMHSFAAGNGGASSLTGDGNSLIQVVSIDDVIPSFAPTLIKLDIEGAEAAALKGAARTIRSCKPNLAVCVYHSPDHLWTVPLLMHKLLPAHKLALRYHQFNGFDAVAYAFRN